MTSKNKSLNEAGRELAEALGDFWHIVRVSFAEDLITLALHILPRGPEKRRMLYSLNAYAEWKDRNEYEH